MFPLWIIFLHLLSQVSASFPFLKTESYQAPLKIDQHKIRSREKKTLSVSSSQLRESNLRKIYEMVEDDSTDGRCKRPHLPDWNLIFANNQFYTYTPAEWAILLNNLGMLEHFVTTAIQNEFIERFIKQAIIKNLLKTSIHVGNLDAFKFLFGTSILNGNQDFLSLAAMHHVNDDFLHFLLEDCGFKHAIEYASMGGPFLSPLETAVKFNNARAAVLFLQAGAKFESPLYAVFTLNRKRILKKFFEHIPDLCQRSFDESILHFAARMSSDAGIIDIIIEKCPGIDVNEVNKQNESPLDLCVAPKPPPATTQDNEAPLELSYGKTSKNASVFESLLLHGANLARNDFKALDSIIRKGFVDLFRIVLKLGSSDDLIITKCVQMIKAHDAWLLFDELLVFKPELIEVIDSGNIPLPSIVANHALITFKMLLQSGKLSNLDAKQLESGTGSEEFLEILKEHS